MNKKPIIGGIILVAILGMVAVGAQINPEYTEESSGSEVWQTRIAGPEYDNISTHVHDLGSLEEGTYKIGFVPMGDSPKNLRVKIVGILPVKNEGTGIAKTLDLVASGINETNENGGKKSLLIDTVLTSGNSDISVHHVMLQSIHSPVGGFKISA